MDCRDHKQSQQLLIYIIQSPHMSAPDFKIVMCYQINMSALFILIFIHMQGAIRIRKPNSIALLLKIRLLKKKRRFFIIKRANILKCFATRNGYNWLIFQRLLQGKNLAVCFLVYQSLQKGDYFKRKKFASWGANYFILKLDPN